MFWTAMTNKRQCPHLHTCLDNQTKLNSFVELTFDAHQGDYALGASGVNWSEESKSVDDT